MGTSLKEVRGLLALMLSLAAGSAWATPATSYFIYDESGHVIGEYDANGNAVQEHVYLGDRPVAVVQGGSSGTVSYVSTDQLNTPRVVTDQNQAVLWSWNSDPFGNGNPTGSLTYNLRFPGQYYDAETGHNYNYFRDYDTTTNRYIESDPTGLEGGLNGYIYADDNPFTEIDVSGLCSSSFDTGYGVGAVYVSRGLPGHCSLNQLRSHVFGPLVRTSGSCSCGDKTMTCTYSLTIEYQERSKNYNCKTHAASGNWSGYGNSMPGPPHDFTFTIDCATNKAISVSTGNITRPL